MSNAREQAWKHYRDTVHKHHGAAKRPFMAGWDAAKADLPDRKAINDAIFGGGQYEAPDRVLALLRGERGE